MSRRNDAERGVAAGVPPEAADVDRGYGAIQPFFLLEPGRGAPARQDMGSPAAWPPPLMPKIDTDLEQGIPVSGN
jgi:hypothetical protein